jgi:aryl-alcohol dehydrogenase-like predicted oxidoreductase
MGCQISLLEAHGWSRFAGVMFQRDLGTRTGVQVSALGLGCWAIGGPWTSNGRPAGWGEVDDDESIRAIRRALELGVTLFDTADVYGCGHSERVLGRALAGRRDDVVVVTKVGNVFDEQTRTAGGADVSPTYLRRACDASLRRLDTDRIDVYLIHDGLAGPQSVPAVIDVLEELVAAGKLRWYGSSMSDPAIVRALAEGPHMVAVQHELNVLRGELEALSAAEDLGLASLNRTPLAMGLLSGRYSPDALPAADDVRRNAPWWDFFDEGAMDRWLQRIAEARAELTADGRSLVQGALGWIWGRSAATLPLPGFRTVAQVEENVGAAAYGPLPTERVERIREILGEPLPA